jgi:hypothetical protein
LSPDLGEDDLTESDLHSIYSSNRNVDRAYGGNHVRSSGAGNDGLSGGLITSPTSTPAEEALRSTVLAAMDAENRCPEISSSCWGSRRGEF